MDWVFILAHVVNVDRGGGTIRVPKETVMWFFINVPICTFQSESVVQMFLFIYVKDKKIMHQMTVYSIN